MNIRTDLDLRLAWQRYRKDLSDRAFCDHPYVAEIIDGNFDEWINDLEEKLSDFNPSPSHIVDIPKPGFHLRPGSVLSPPDGTVYQALLLKEIEKIRRGLLWSSQQERFSYILKEDQTGTDWFINNLIGWTSFREYSLSLLDSGNCWVVFADISGYFENISIGRLISDLERLNVGKEILDPLSSCLNRWAEPRKRGIPQANSCSSILGEVYLDVIDRGMKNQELCFCRYVDDMRIFCRTKHEAITALHLLTKLLRQKELNLQTTKSFIKSGSEARNDISGVSQLITETEIELRHELEHIFDHDMNYASPRYIEEGMSEISLQKTSLTVLQRVFDANIVHNPLEFDKTLFHYCIKRFGAAKDEHALEFCLSIILDRPEEFEYVLNYLTKLVDILGENANRVLEIIKASTGVFDRHRFLFLRWMYNNNLVNDNLLSFCRQLFSDGNIGIHTRYYVWAILGRHGDSADLDLIEAEYANVETEISRASIICATKRLVKRRRNSFYARAKSDGLLVKLAINISKMDITSVN